jgi:hypothetical protein
MWRQMIITDVIPAARNWERGIGWACLRWGGRRTVDLAAIALSRTATPASSSSSALLSCEASRGNTPSSSQGAARRRTRQVRSRAVGPNCAARSCCISGGR